MLGFSRKKQTQGTEVEDMEFPGVLKKEPVDSLEVN